MLVKIFKKYGSIKNYLITKFFSLLFNRFGKNSYIYGDIKAYIPNNIYIGNNTKINYGVLLNALSNIYIGDNCNISSYSQIQTGMLDIYNKSKKHISKEVIIGNNVWIASGVVILGGVKIGDNSIIGAGAVVTKDVPANELWGGVPAYKIKKL